jgi:hypothetical protein
MCSRQRSAVRATCCSCIFEVICVDINTTPNEADMTVKQAAGYMRPWIPVNDSNKVAEYGSRKWLLEKSPIMKLRSNCIRRQVYGSYTATESPTRMKKDFRGGRQNERSGEIKYLREGSGRGRAILGYSTSYSYCRYWPPGGAGHISAPHPCGTALR